MLKAASDAGATLRHFLRRRLKQDSEVDDLLQEVYIRLLEARPDTIRDPGQYVLAVAKQVMAEKLRSRDSLRSDADEPLEIPGLAMDAEVVTGEPGNHESEDLLAEQWIVGAINKLPAVDRAILRLRLEGYTIDEISAQVGIPIDRVRRDLARARAQLSSHLRRFARGVVHEAPGRT